MTTHKNEGLIITLNILDGRPLKMNIVRNTVFEQTHLYHNFYQTLTLDIKFHV